MIVCNEPHAVQFGHAMRSMLWFSVIGARTVAITQELST